MMKKTPLLCLFFLACSFLAFAQERTITGKISEETNKSSIAGATITVKGGRKTVTADANGAFSLAGKIANVQINQGSGGLGSGAKIVLRGNKSIQGSNNALIVVDGVPALNPTYSTAGNDFGSVQSSDGASDINPDDIESVNVLRGASAAALYGSQAGKGLLSISTKKAKK